MTSFARWLVRLPIKLAQAIFRGIHGDSWAFWGIVCCASWMGFLVPAAYFKNLYIWLLQIPILLYAYFKVSGADKQ